MVATGARVRELNSILELADFRAAGQPPALRTTALPENAVAQIRDLYETLGGPLGSPALKPGSWDLSFSGGLLVELDEAFHFNRYREQTLLSDWAGALPWRLEYLEYCREWEKHSGKGGKRWANPSATRMFGGADPDGVFGQFGASRWRQRALYDSMKDIAAAHGCVRLSRVSIYDRIDGVLLDDVLYKRAELPPESVAAFVCARVAKT
jgi:hypothetical protein